MTYLPAAVWKLINHWSWKMKATPRKLLFLVVILFPHFNRTEFCYESQGSILYNQVLIGHVYKSFLTRGILNCGQKCLADARCASYNYQTSAFKDGVCELNENSIERKELFEEKRGFAFVRMRRKTIGILLILLITWSVYKICFTLHFLNGHEQILRVSDKATIWFIL